MSVTRTSAWVCGLCAAGSVTRLQAMNLRFDISYREIRCDPQSRSLALSILFCASFRRVRMLHRLLVLIVVACWKEIGAHSTVAARRAIGLQQQAVQASIHFNGGRLE